MLVGLTLPERASPAEVSRSLGAEVGESIGPFVHVVLSVSAHVREVHGDATRFEGGEQFGVAPCESFVLLWLPRACGGTSTAKSF